MHLPRSIAHRLVGILFRILAALLFGAIVSVAIAIWAANTDRGRIRWIRTPATAPAVVPHWTVQVNGYSLMSSASFYPREFPGDRGAQIDAWLAMVPDADLRRFVRPLLDEPSWHLSVQSAGWPLHSLACHDRSVQKLNRSVSVERSSISWDAPWLRTIWIPTRPLWRNLAADAALFGAPVFLFLLAVAPLRGWRRRRKGLCPDCAYDLKGDLAAGCPECAWNRDSVKPPGGT